MHVRLQVAGEVQSVFVEHGSPTLPLVAEQTEVVLVSGWQVVSEYDVQSAFEEQPGKQ